MLCMCGCAQYERQGKVLLGRWSDSAPNLLGKPSYTDADGALELRREFFNAPDGWLWDGCDPLRSVLFTRIPIVV